MGGSIPFEVALKARLDICKPSKFDIEKTLRERPFELNSGIKELVKDLQRRNCDVYLVSGGFQQMIDPVAVELGIPSSNIYANVLQFNPDNG